MAGIIYVIIGFIEVIIGLRFLFLLVGANPANTIVNWVYEWSTPVIAPFAGIVGQSATVAGQGVATRSVFDWTALLALLVYGLIGVVIAGLVARR